MNVYLQFSVNALRRNPLFCLLIILVISAGIGASTTMMTVLRNLAKEPVPVASASIFHPQIEPAVVGREASHRLPDDLTWTDALALFNAKAGGKRALSVGGQVAISPAQAGDHVFLAHARYTTAGFFQLFQVPFTSGGPWRTPEDQRHARVVVISRGLAQRMYGRSPATGHSLRLGQTDFQVVGVLDDWNPMPHFYDLGAGSYANSEDVYIPYATASELRFDPTYSLECWGSGMPDPQHMENAPCTWVQFWIELPTRAAQTDYRHFMAGYIDEQIRLGRFTGHPNFALPNIGSWLQQKHAFPAAARLQAFMSYSFLALCLFHAMALMLVMFMRRRYELALRRALGATKRQIHTQLLAETAGLSLLAAVLSLLFSMLGLWLVKQQPQAYYTAVHLDLPMVATAVLAAVAGTLLASSVPAWQVGKLPPSAVIKS